MHTRGRLFVPQFRFVSPWAISVIIIDMPKKRPNRNKAASSSEGPRQWAEVATTHGIYYVFEKDVRSSSRCVWAVICIALSCLAAGMIRQSYADWKENPVLTTVETTGLPLDKIDFPAITICGLGTIAESVEMAVMHQMKQFYMDKGLPYNPPEDAEVDAIKDIYLARYMNGTYPGLELELETMVTTMLSPDPDELLRAKVSSQVGRL